MDEVCSVCCFGDGDSFAYDPNPNSFNDLPNFSDYPPQPQYETYSCELCGNDSHHGYDCPPRFPLVYEQEPSYNQNFSDNYYPQNSPSFPQQYLCCENCGGPHESFQCQPMNQNYFEPNYSGFDQPLQYSINHQPPSIQENFNYQKIYELLQMMQSFCEKLLQQKQAANIYQSPLQEMNYRNEKIDIRFRRECESMIDELKGKFNGMSIEINKKKELQRLEQVANLSTYPSQRFKSFCYDDDDYEESTIPLNEFSEDTSESDSDCDLPSCDDFSPINVYKEKSVTFSNPLFDSNDDFTSSDDESISDEDVPEENVKIYSNPLFEFDDEYISSDVNPLFDEVLEDIESKDSYVSNLDELALLVTPLSYFNEDECFDPGGDVDEIEFLLHRDPSTTKISVASILEGFTDEPPLEENDDLFDLESKENEWKKILYDAPIDDLMTEDKVFDLGIHEKKFLQLHISKHKIQECLNIEEKSIPQASTRSRKLRINPTLRNFTISTKRIPLSDFEIPPVTPNVETVNSLSMGDKHLDTSKDSLESSVRDPVPIPSESADLSDGESECDDEFNYFSNPLYDLDDEIITNEKFLPNQKDLDVVIPIPPGIDERCFNAKSDLLESLQNREIQIDSTKIDSIFNEFSLPFPPKIPSFSQDEMDLVFDDSIPHGIDDDDDSEGDILFVEPVATMENNIKELNEDESFDPGEGGNVVLPNVEEDDTFTFIIHTFLPFVTYPEVSLLTCSTRSEDTIFDPGISTFHFSSLKPVAYENPMVIFLFFCFCPKDKGFRGESS
ncbi:hypothetical protein Tco_0143839 [Tanacetum coccineum]